VVVAVAALRAVTVVALRATWPLYPSRPLVVAGRAAVRWAGGTRLPGLGDGRRWLRRRPGGGPRRGPRRGLGGWSGRRLQRGPRRRLRRRAGRGLGGWSGCRLRRGSRRGRGGWARRWSGRCGRNRGRAANRAEDRWTRSHGRRGRCRPDRDDGIAGQRRSRWRDRRRDLGRCARLRRHRRLRSERGGRLWSPGIGRRGRCSIRGRRVACAGACRSGGRISAGDPRSRLGRCDESRRERDRRKDEVQETHRNDETGALG
jgi:hypothetical protein